MIYFSTPFYKYGRLESELIPIAQQFGKDASFLDNRIGTKFLYTFENQDEILSAVSELVAFSLSSCHFEKSDINAIFFVGQTRLQNCIPHFSSLIHNVLRLSPDCLCLDLGHGCSGYIVALDAVQAWCSLYKKNALLITCDPYRSIVDPSDVSTSLLFSDAISVTIASSQPIPNSITVSNFQHFSHSSDFHFISYQKNGSLLMNGRQVMSYVNKLVLPQLVEYCDKNKLFSKTNCINVLPHHGSKSVVDLFCQSLDPSIFNIIYDRRFSGNTVSSSIPIVLSNCSCQIRQQPITVMIGFGVGLSTSICSASYHD